MPVSSTATFAHLVSRFQAAGASMSLSASSASAYCCSKPGSFGLFATAIGTLSSTRSTLGAASRRVPQRLATSHPRASRPTQPREPAAAATRADRRRRRSRALIGVAHARAELDQQPGGRPRLAARARISVGAEAESAPRPAPRRPQKDAPQRPSGWSELLTPSSVTLLRPGKGRLALGRDALEVLAYGRDLLAHVAAPEQPPERARCRPCRTPRRSSPWPARRRARRWPGWPARRPSRRRRSRRRPAAWPPPPPARPSSASFCASASSCSVAATSSWVAPSSRASPVTSAPAATSAAVPPLLCLLLGGRRRRAAACVASSSSCVVVPSSCLVALSSSSFGARQFLLGAVSSSCVLSRSDRSVSAQISRPTATSPNPALTQIHALRRFFGAPSGGADAASGCGLVVDMPTARLPTRPRGASPRPGELSRGGAATRRGSRPRIPVPRLPRRRSAVRSSRRHRSRAGCRASCRSRSSR